MTYGKTKSCSTEGCSIIRFGEACRSHRHMRQYVSRIYMTVAQCSQQWIIETTVSCHSCSGLPRTTDAREDRAIRRSARSAPKVSLSFIRRHLPVDKNRMISKQIVCISLWAQFSTSFKAVDTNPSTRLIVWIAVDLGQAGQCPIREM